jgi:hypothetical protein
VAGHLFPPNEEIPGREEHGTRSVQKGIHCRQAGNGTTFLDLGLSAYQNERHPQEDEKRDQSDTRENQPILHIVITAAIRVTRIHRCAK